MSSMFVPKVIAGMKRRHIALSPSEQRVWYLGTMVQSVMTENLLIERVQTGVRMEKRLLKVLKAFAEFKDMSLGDLLEGIVLHAFDGKAPFGEDSLRRISELKKFYGLELTSEASHRLKETAQPSAETPRQKTRRSKRS